MTDLRIFSLSPPDIRNSYRFAIRTRPAKTAVSKLISAAQMNSARAAQKAIDKGPDLVKMVPGKKDIRFYCMQDLEFSRLAKLAKGGPGSCAAQKQLAQRKFELLRDLPFGPILQKEN